MTTALTNEPIVIADIRAKMQQLKQLAVRHHRNHLAQWEAYTQDITAPAAPGSFTSLEESQAQLTDEYDTLKIEILRQMSYYDAFCDQNSLAYSASWNLLLQELTPYLSGMSALVTGLDAAERARS